MEMNLPKAPTYNDLRKLTDYLVEKTSKKELEMLMLEAYTKKVDNTITKNYQSQDSPVRQEIIGSE